MYQSLKCLSRKHGFLLRKFVHHAFFQRWICYFVYPILLPLLCVRYIWLIPRIVLALPEVHKTILFFRVTQIFQYKSLWKHATTNETNFWFAKSVLLMAWDTLISVQLHVCIHCWLVLENFSGMSMLYSQTKWTVLYRQNYYLLIYYWNITESEKKAKEAFIPKQEFKARKNLSLSLMILTARIHFESNKHYTGDTCTCFFWFQQNLEKIVTHLCSYKVLSFMSCWPLNIENWKQTWMWPVSGRLLIGTSKPHHSGFITLKPYNKSTCTLPPPAKSKFYS